MRNRWRRALAAGIGAGLLGGALTAPAAAQTPRTAPRLELGAGVGYHAYGQIEDQACAGVESCSTDESAIAPFVQVKWRPFDVPLVLGGSFDVATGIETMQAFDGISNEVDLDIYTLGATAGWDLLSPERLILGAFVGIAQAWNRAIARTSSGGEERTEDRDESGLRLQGGAELEYRLGGPWHGLLGYRYLTGGGDDADAHHAIRVGIVFGGEF